MLSTKTYHFLSFPRGYRHIYTFIPGFCSLHVRKYIDFSLQLFWVKQFSQEKTGKGQNWVVNFLEHLMNFVSRLKPWQRGIHNKCTPWFKIKFSQLTFFWHSSCPFGIFSLTTIHSILTEFVVFGAHGHNISINILLLFLTVSTFTVPNQYIDTSASKGIAASDS